MTHYGEKSLSLKNYLADGSLKDSRVYHVKEGKMTDRQSRPIGTFKSVQKNKDWSNLLSLTHAINAHLQINPAEHLILFNEGSYEHNSDDNFLIIKGSDAGNFTLETGNIIGFAKKGHFSLSISSRFGDQFLKYIIADADGFLELDNLGGAKSDQGYDWLLAYLWVIKLKRAFRLGLPKIYTTRNECIPKVRGQIDPVDFFLNKDQGQYLCAYREHSYDSPALSLFMAAYQNIQHYDFSKQSHDLYKTFVMANEGMKRSRQDILKTPYFSNPYYQDYNVLIDLSKRLLTRKGMDFGGDQNSAFLFDISMLFEYFIVKLLKRTGLSVQGKFDECKKIPAGVLGNYRRKIEPDIVFEVDGGICVFDVKYKYYDERFGVAREDLFQLHSYIGQYGNEMAVKSCGFIYPLSEQRWGKIFSDKEPCGIISAPLKQQGKEIPFHVVFLKIPKTGERFPIKMKEATEAFDAVMSSGKLLGTKTNNVG